MTDVVHASVVAAENVVAGVLEAREAVFVLRGWCFGVIFLPAVTFQVMR